LRRQLIAFPQIAFAVADVILVLRIIDHCQA